jgi:hypothetical protein
MMELVMTLGFQEIKIAASDVNWLGTKELQAPLLHPLRMTMVATLQDTKVAPEHISCQPLRK